MAGDVVLGEPRVFRDVGATLSETPFWDGGALHWADIPRGLLHVSPGDGPVDGSQDRVLELPPPLPCIQPAEGGGYVAALKDRIVLLDIDGTITAELARVALPNDRMRLNEGKVDPQGGLFVGAMDADDADAAWYRVSGSGAAVHLGGFGITNGLEWSIDGATVYLADTSVSTIYRAPWDAESGPGELTMLHSGDAVDGAALDDTGCLWTAVNGAGVVLRLDPAGRELERVELPVKGLSGVCFGGDRRGTLFVCSSAEGMSDADRAAAPLAGAVFAVDTAVHGLPLRPFRTP
ncbi:MAG TPA: SMP-30/gluconolactonase/LRE family protein [Amnibacterium sp.]|uniref:SMP-30/gluconolactonase/LRE family protein n=1 Tax=Amnibacterium sp. TaxID=1872496 RepID=UPI002F94E5D6